MSDDDEFESLDEEIEDLQDQIRGLNFQVKILAVFVFVLIVLQLMSNTNSIGFLIIVTLLVIPMALCFRELEKHGVSVEIYKG